MITICNAYINIISVFSTPFSLYFCETKHITMTGTRTKTTMMMMTRVQSIYWPCLCALFSVHCVCSAVHSYRVLCLFQNMEMKNCENKTKQKHELRNREQDYEQIIISNGWKRTQYNFWLPLDIDDLLYYIEPKFNCSLSDRRIMCEWM